LIIFFFLAPIIYWLSFGEHGFVHLYRTEMKRQAYLARIQKLAEKNQALMEEVQRLRKDMKYVETVARDELNLVKKNEVIYRFREQEAYSNRTKSLPTDQSVNKKK